MSELLIEIYSEEIPARMQLQAAADFKGLWEKALAEKNAAFKAIDTYVAPQRLTAHITGLAANIRGTEEVRRGPKASAPEAALAGFLKSTGKTKDQLIQKDDYWYAELSQAGKPIQELLPEILNEVMDKMPWPKTMRWYNHQTKQMSKPWIRPIRSILCVYDGNPVNFNVPDFGINTGNTTFGHRFLARQALTVTSFEDYKAQLEKAHVILDHQKRQEMIEQLIREQAAARGLVLKKDIELLREVAGLVDYPFAHLGKIEESFMHLPGVVMSTSMRVHQKYFTIVDKGGQIAPFFGVITNVPRKPDNHLMLDGLERVLRARLSDAAFFYDVDMKDDFDGKSAKLDHIVYHAKLGSLGDKVKRLQNLMSSADGKRAAKLCKNDLLTEMVGEFPELQGIMGEIYAKEKGEKPEVAAALREHYLPQGMLDVEGVPTALISAELALMDKLDTLVGFLGVGLKPTGSKDPFGLRRAAVGIIRLILHEKNDALRKHTLDKMIADVAREYKSFNVSIKEEDVAPFIYERFKAILIQQYFDHDCIDAIFSKKSGNLWVDYQCIETLQSFLKTEAGIALRAAYKRASGILSKGQTIGTVSESLLKETAEKQLFAALSALEQKYQDLFGNHQYQQVMELLASLRKPIDAFFDTVTVNVDDEKLKENRYALLNHFISLVNQIADFSKLQG
ncbi:MAG: glycine--tRNA ligase subunit beta [Alphaproteobacteria bacterium]|nr:glycine--tRNA ligase subunit beta [Alphaproteobacteria bacterium]